MTTIRVQARAGIKVPREENARKYVTDEAAVEVPDSIYYRRRIADGDLVEVKHVAEAPAQGTTVEVPDADKTGTKKGGK